MGLTWNSLRAGTVEQGIRTGTWYQQDLIVLGNCIEYRIAPPGAQTIIGTGQRR